MKLKDKGPIKQAPLLTGPAQEVSEAIQSWPNIISATHWAIGDSTKVNGADFYVDDMELGHIHLDGEMHLSLTQNLAKLLISQKLAEPFRWGESWVQLDIKDKQSVELAAWLFKLGYDRIKGATATDLKQRITERRR